VQFGTYCKLVRVDSGGGNKPLLTALLVKSNILRRLYKCNDCDGIVANASQERADYDEA
jgi:hypothetical protein